MSWEPTDFCNISYNIIISRSITFIRLGHAKKPQMEPVQPNGIVNGLLNSLGNALQVLEDFAPQLTSEEFGSNLKDAETAIRSSRSDLETIQGNLETKSMQSQPDDLLIVLENAALRLRTIGDNIQKVETLRSKLFLRSPSRFLQRPDMEVAKRLTALALDTVEMIRDVHGRTQHAEPVIEISRYTDAVSTQTRKRAEVVDISNKSNGHTSLCLTEHLATNRQRSHFPPLLTAVDTKAQRIFACMSVPKEQDSFHQRCRAARFTGTCDWFLGTKIYESWREHLKCSGEWGVLWCQGNSGIGKTMLA